MDRGVWWATVHRVTKSWTHWATEHTHTCNIQRCCGALWWAFQFSACALSIACKATAAATHSHWCLGSGLPIKPNRTNETVSLVRIWTWKTKMSWIPAGDLIIECVNSEALTFSPLAINLREQMSAEKQGWSRQADKRDEGEGEELENVAHTFCIFYRYFLCEILL